MSDPKRTVGEPHDRLTRIANAMLEAGNAHPERQDERAIVMLSSEAEKQSAVALGGYDTADDSEALIDMFMHLKAILNANGKNLLILPLGEG